MAPYSETFCFVCQGLCNGRKHQIVAEESQTTPDAKPVALVIYCSRKAGLSVEDFNEYWSKKHAPFFTSIGIVKRNLLKYTQYHFSCDDMAKVAQKGVPILSSFDGAAEFVAKDLDSIMQIFSDPEYKEKIVPDEWKFLDKSSARWSVGYNEVLLDRTSSTTAHYPSRSCRLL